MSRRCPNLLGQASGLADESSANLRSRGAYSAPPKCRPNTIIVRRIIHHDTRLSLAKNGLASRNGYGKPDRLGRRNGYGKPNRLDEDNGYGKPDRLTDNNGYDEPDRLADSNVYGEPDRLADDSGYEKPDRLDDDNGYEKADRLADDNSDYEKPNIIMRGTNG